MPKITKKMPSEITTLCFHTRDAVHVKDASYTFNMPSDRLKENAGRVALASCEFPMVQWTIEEEWCRFWMNEGIRLDSETNFLEVFFRGEEEERSTVRIPPRTNKIKKVTRRGKKVHVECEREHGLGGYPKGREIKIVGGSGGDFFALHTEVESEHSFFMEVEGGEEGFGRVTNAKYVIVPTISSPSELCSMLTSASRSVRMGGILLSFSYKGEEDRIVATGTVVRKGSSARFLPTPLSSSCGLSTTVLHFETNVCEWASEQTGLWDYVEVKSGFYGPCHRSMCVGQPLRLSQEMEMSVNRFYFPIGGGSGGEEGEHLVVFSDPDGRILTCSIPPGRYRAETLCVHLENGMTSSARQFGKKVSFSIRHDEEGRFVFSCERERGGRYVEARFGLLFHHPLSVEGERFGFPSQAMTGSHTYVAPLPTRTPSPPVSKREGRANGNLLRVSEIASQKRFRINVSPPPPILGVVEGGKGGTVLVRTFVNRIPFSHGFQKMDSIRIVPHSDCTVVEGGEEVEVRGTSASIPMECTCIVQKGESEDPCLLSFLSPPLDGLLDKGTCVQIVSDVEPFNFTFAKRGTIPPHCIGFPPSSVEWGVDGTVSNGEGSLLPPIEAPFSHCLDHPDYVLMTFSESSGATFEHSYNGENKSIFCKLSLYPLFREERMLPRDTSLLRSNMGSFTLSFWNPDMKTPYQFHGTQFSFSLNFVHPSHN